MSDINNVQILDGLKQGDRVADRVVEPSDAEITNGMRVKAAGMKPIDTVESQRLFTQVH